MYAIITGTLESALGEELAYLVRQHPVKHLGAIMMQELEHINTGAPIYIFRIVKPEVWGQHFIRPSQLLELSTVQEVNDFIDKHNEDHYHIAIDALMRAHIEDLQQKGALDFSSFDATSTQKQLEKLHTLGCLGLDKRKKYPHIR